MEPTGAIAAGGLAAQLRDGTRAEHERAESTPFVTRLLDGAVPLDGYVRYLVQLTTVYAALERDPLPADPQVAALCDPALRRLPALCADLEHLAGPGWAARCSVSAATRSYGERIDDVRTRWPGGYVAHHYTRYLGDLSGGQAIAAALRRHYGLSGGDGTRFFTFDGIGPVKPYKDRYRAALDTFTWDPAERALVVAEARTAFRHNRRLLRALGP